MNVAESLKRAPTWVDVQVAPPPKRRIRKARHLDNDTESRDQHMMARVRTTIQKRAEGEKGFTLIELLVVIIIIGILAAIAIPAFLNQRQNGWRAQVQSDLKNAAIAAESYAVGNNGSYADLDATDLTNNGFRGTNGVTVTVGTPTADAYTLTGRHNRLGTESWTYSSNTGVISTP